MIDVEEINFELSLDELSSLIRPEDSPAVTIFDQKSIVKNLFVHPNGSKPAEREVPADVQTKLFENSLLHL
ncbi:MAG: hypothetical protein KGO94_10705 [Alphaproteobacteria bacterium]|nr:hypothetical protein [Alphaproteobacteria bacterium]